jgi:hypothetical protein
MRSDSFRMSEMNMMGPFYIDDAEILARRPINIEILGENVFGEILKTVRCSNDE